MRHIVVGDVVKLKSGSRKMTVESIEGFNANLIYYKPKADQVPPYYGTIYEDEPSRLTLPLETLEVYR